MFAEGQGKDEFDIYKLVTEANPRHPGHKHVRTAFDQFSIHRSGVSYLCLVQKPMWDSFGDLLYRNPTRRFTLPLLKAGLSQVFLALDYLHTQCHLVHTGRFIESFSRIKVDRDYRYQRR